MPKPKHDPELLVSIGSRIQQARRARGMTQAQLSESIRIEPVTLSRYETGSRGPSITTLARTAETLGIRLGDLVDDDRELPEPNFPQEIEQAISILKRMEKDRLDLVIRLLRELAV